MILYRYELVYEEQLQNIGFLVGLKDIGFPKEKIDKLIKPFQDYLIIPHGDIYELKGVKFYFTEKGKEKFEKYINRIKEELENVYWGIKEFILEIDLIDLEKIKYVDKYQIAIQNDI